MTISGYDCCKRKGLSQRRKLENVCTETVLGQSIPDPRSRKTLKVRLPTVDSGNIGTTRRLELAERSARQPYRSATWTNGPRYRGAVSCRTLYVSTAILYWMRSGTGHRPLVSIHFCLCCCLHLLQAVPGHFLSVFKNTAFQTMLVCSAH